VGGGGALDADKAAEVIAQLEPRIIIPMHYLTQHTTLKLDPLARFLKEMGAAEHEPQESLRVTRSNLPEEPQVVVLECKQG
jgi:L-ascorbate metabolism protein UlaG (beta-lactamase superfamily)